MCVFFHCDSMAAIAVDLYKIHSHSHSRVSDKPGEISVVASLRVSDPTDWYALTE